MKLLPRPILTRLQALLASERPAEVWLAGGARFSYLCDAQ
jgi:hypothetical protein